jgi:hypothetical protein
MSQEKKGVWITISMSDEAGEEFMRKYRAKDPEVMAFCEEWGIKQITKEKPTKGHHGKLC